VLVFYAVRKGSRGVKLRALFVGIIKLEKMSGKIKGTYPPKNGLF